jgi:hypothetical protein
LSFFKNKSRKKSLRCLFLQTGSLRSFCNLAHEFHFNLSLHAFRKIPSMATMKYSHVTCALWSLIVFSHPTFHKLYNKVRRNLCLYTHLVILLLIRLCFFCWLPNTLRIYSSFSINLKLDSKLQY